MTQYIDKSAVVEEIKGYISNYKEIVAKINRNDSTWVNSVSMIESKIDVLQHLLSFLNTLEMKEIGVDLGDPKGDIGVKTVWDSSNSLEISQHWNPHIGESLEEAATKYAQDKYLPVQTAQSFKAGAQWQKEQMINNLKNE